MSSDPPPNGDDPTPTPIPLWLRLAEATAVVLLVLHCLFGHRSTFIEMTVFAVLSGAILWLAARGALPAAPAAQSARGAFGLLIAFTLLALIVMAIYGATQQVRPVPRLVFETAIVYVPYAYLQQFLTQRYLVVRVNAWAGWDALKVALLVGAVFGVLHLPWPKLIAPTILAGFVWSYAYLKGGRVWPIAASHAVLAVGFFMLVLDRAPFRDAFTNAPWGG